jgi:hypothetical protein
LRTYFEAKLTRLIILRLCDVLENRGGAVAMLENQIAYQEPITLPCPEAKCQFLSKHVASAFILETLALAAANPGDEGIFVCHRLPSTSLLEIARKLATLYGLQLESELSVRFLNVPSSTSEVVPHSLKENRCVLVPTANANISLLQEQYSHEVVKQSCHLLHLQESQENDFEPLILEHHTHNLLLQEHLT